VRRLATSLRTRPAAATTAVGRHLMRRFGITQVLDITALDRLGMPVSVSLRPHGQAARIHAGKGVAAADAQAGALMEAIECAVAEQAGAGGPCARLPLCELAARLPGGLSMSDFAPRLGTDLAPARPTAAVRCTDLLSRARPLLPAELVMVPGPHEAGLPPLFGWSTNGLASGNTLQEATLHALLEVLERDTIAMSAVRGNAALIDPQSLPESFANRAGHWRGLGVQLHVRLLPGDFDLPCFEATLYEPGHAHAELARGWGIHFDRRMALARAVSEAAQVRLCTIHSQMPDMAGLYGQRLRGATLASDAARQRFLAALADAAMTHFQAAPHREHHRLDAALQDLLSRLQARGFRHAFRRRMQPGGGRDALLGLHVVKVIVPRCETILGSSRRAGPRLAAAVSARLSAAQPARASASASGVAMAAPI